jgi:hypothetical protein
MIMKGPTRAGRRVIPRGRTFLAVLPHWLPRDVLSRFRLLVRPETVLRSVALQIPGVTPVMQSTAAGQAIGTNGILTPKPKIHARCIWRLPARGGYRQET